MIEYPCPHCKQLIYDEEALLCHFCGESLRRSSQGVMGKMTGGWGKWVFALIVLLVIVSLIIF